MEISENSRVWIYQSNRALNIEEENRIGIMLNDFTSQWLAHGQSLAAKSEIRYHQFIILSIDEQVAGATGCSIDKSVYLMKEMEKEFNLYLFDRFGITYRDGENIVICTREEFEKLLRTGKVNSKTIVFNNMVSSRKELLTAWEVPMKDSWHARVFADQIRQE